jgi:hypothetical protein
MTDTISETEACDLLSRLFKSRGYAIRRNLVFREYGVEFHIDGWDAKNRVGFEFLTSEDDDHDDLSLEEYQTLSAFQQRGELSLFILDEVEPLSEADLAEMANEFLDEVAAARKPRRGKASAKGASAGRTKKATSPAKKVAKKVAKHTARKSAVSPAKKLSKKRRAKTAVKAAASAASVAKKRRRRK